MFMNCEEWQGNVGTHLDAPLQCPNATFKAAFIKAVKRGTITWHAGPMNQQSEFMSQQLFKFGPPRAQSAPRSLRRALF